MSRIGRRAIPASLAERRSGRNAVARAEASLAAADAYDAVQPQAWILRLPREAVLARARAVDARLAAGETLPLAGATFAVKDNIDLAGAATTAACPAYAYRPERDAEVVRRLVAAGAVPIGKTNLDQFATGLTGTRTPYGACGCVFERAFISGGSSSGSAVAAAAGVVDFALGTDTAGSGRVPAAFNGLVGLKPTRGRWSTRGVVPACRSLDCVSVLAASVADARRIDRVLAAFDPDEPFSRAAPARRSGRLRVLAVPKPEALDWNADPGGLALFDAAVAAATRLAEEVVVFDIAPLLQCARLLYQGPWVAERAAAMASILRDNPGAIHPVVRAIAQAAAHVTAAEAFQGLYALKAFERDAARLWAAADALILPTTPAIFRIAEVEAEPFGLNATLGAYTNFVNLLDMAAIAIPAGWRANGTGFGISLIGPAWSDPALSAFAEALRSSEPRERPPLDLTARAPTVKLAVFGAHLTGMPLHWQLSSRAARFLGEARTAPTYRLFAMAGEPPKPALAYDPAGAAVAAEIFELDQAQFGGFVADIAAPLAIGAVTLENGETVRGFIAEPRALAGARDITACGGWRAFLAETGGR